jgi:hypothetical protein
MGEFRGGELSIHLLFLRIRFAQTNMTAAVPLNTIAPVDAPLPPMRSGGIFQENEENI